MEIDMVHDVQNAYRKLLVCMSRPGNIESLGEESNKVHIDANIFNSTLVLMFILLDSEVSFKVVSKYEDKISKIVQSLTYSTPTNIEEADFIFLLEDQEENSLKQIITKSKIGDLINPHKSATIIVETSKIDYEKKLLLKGPGIKTETYIDLKLEQMCIEELCKKNIEFPMGIDMIFVDKNSNITCLPRTTKVLRKVN
ncbi:alpha-D-ribose 1-methylphosphonate 5-triphosphate synthase subunit PhnH [Clostridium acidisoli DSM 12555]|uniref:Alpha-D-ribose 1-methylphosphonate 5-triphosphate synthase subunit PhnH n=1 Tax=Clostridium acidisoli DSM 12555 TaxID=1121291 RepID=A0A1W1XT84_9CLOT|nr:phosphonate C-P lyase system protein PhnH [Clostridium acidisoli]SMC27055.1 alpha-D-ribose 1-methylphosphonate 5-triphosphate synthase subunit PhnH [Clostridium acidisoli DSM 12555]